MFLILFLHRGLSALNFLSPLWWGMAGARGGIAAPSPEEETLREEAESFTYKVSSGWSSTCMKQHGDIINMKYLCLWLLCCRFSISFENSEFRNNNKK